MIGLLARGQAIMVLGIKGEVVAVVVEGYAGTGTTRPDPKPI